MASKRLTALRSQLYYNTVAAMREFTRELIDNEPSAFPLTPELAAEMLVAAEALAKALKPEPDQREAELEQWVRNQAYAPDDIVLGPHTVLDKRGLANLQRLLDIAHPQWRNALAKPATGLRAAP